MSASSENLYVQEIAHLARAWADSEIDLEEYRTQRARLVDAFEEAMNDATRPYPPGRRGTAKKTRKTKKTSPRRWFRFWPAMFLVLLVGMVTTAVWVAA